MSLKSGGKVLIKTKTIKKKQTKLWEIIKVGEK